jgi:hypothetical protein
MKLCPNLAGSLRFYFGLARVLILVFGAFWFFTLTFGPSIQRKFADQPKLMVSVGEVSIQPRSGPVQLNSPTASPGSLVLTGLRGPFQADLLSSDTALISALRWTIFPSITVLIVFSWLLCSALRSVCANIERREVFSDTNLRLVRNVGVLLLVFSGASLLVQLFTGHVMDGYLAQHVTASGLENAAGSPLHFQLLPEARLPIEPGFVMGLVVLLLSQAFRQGLALKTENDLTV